MRLSIRRFPAAIRRLACLAFATGLAERAAAQSTTSLQTDATVLPKYTFGIRALTAFTRFDEQLGDGFSTRGRNIASSFTTDSFATAQLAPVVETLTGDPTIRVTGGPLVAKANSRIVTAPLIVEFGVTSRLTVGIVVPFVEARTTSAVQLNPPPASANLGGNPGAAEWATTGPLVTSLLQASVALGQQLAICQANPGGAGCTDLLAQQADVQSLIQQTGPFANALAALYGTSATQPGFGLVPLTGSPAQAAIEARVNAIRASYASFGTTVADGLPVGADLQPANNDLRSTLLSAGYDTLQSPTQRWAMGDVTVGATLQFWNSFGDTTHAGQGGFASRFAAHAAARFGTGQPAQRNRFFDNATGYGQNGVILGAATDLRFARRLFLNAIGSFTKQLGDIDVARLANAGNAMLPLTSPTPARYSAGDEVSVTLSPRYRLAGLLTIDGIWSFHRTAADQYTAISQEDAPLPLDAIVPTPFSAVLPYGAASATSHTVGFGFTYSSALTDKGPGRLPYEASFRHTEVLAASGGPVDKRFTDQIQLRVFFR